MRRRTELGRILPRTPDVAFECAAVRVERLTRPELPQLRMYATQVPGSSFGPTALNRLRDSGGLSSCILTRLAIVDSGAWRPVLLIEVFSTSSKTGVAHEWRFFGRRPPQHVESPCLAGVRKPAHKRERGPPRRVAAHAAFVRNSVRPQAVGSGDTKVVLSDV